MNDSNDNNYLPFERNNYFSGKLLSAGDFKLEQNYHNNKRRLLNSFIYGGGVLCGLQVVRVDETVISVEAGAAVDFLGREIVLDKPQTKKLSLIEGYKPNNPKPYIYLGLRYEEKKADFVHNLMNPEEEYHNAILETGQLFLTAEEIIPEYSLAESIFCSSETLYSDDNLLVILSVPRYAEAGGQYEVKLKIRKLNRLDHKVTLKFTLTGIYSEAVNGDKNLEIFAEEKDGESEILNYGFIVKTATALPKQEELKLIAESFTLTFADEEYSLAEDLYWTITITDEPVEDKLIEDYYKLNLHDLLQERKNSKVFNLYLAKIFYIPYGNSYVIDKVVNNPFKQYIKNFWLKEYKTLKQTEINIGLNISKSFEEKLTVILKEFLELSKLRPFMASGRANIEIGIRGKKNAVYFSEEISHGLGAGDVHIHLGALSAKKSGEAIYFGAYQIFDPGLPKLELGAALNPEQGTFKIGVKLLENTGSYQLLVSWTAFKSNTLTALELDGKFIKVIPEIAKVGCRKQFKFNYESLGIDQKAVTWEVKDSGGGEIDSDGLYTAPAVPGIYEIKLNYEEIGAAAFVIVQ